MATTFPVCEHLNNLEIGEQTASNKKPFHSWIDQSHTLKPRHSVQYHLNETQHHMTKPLPDFHISNGTKIPLILNKMFQKFILFLKSYINSTDM